MPSLTLTDPDMILPDNGRDRESSTPSPPSLDYLSQLNARHGLQNGANAGSSMAAQRAPKKNFSRHVWTHEDGNARRLSDIGEEWSPSRVADFADAPGAKGDVSSGDAPRSTDDSAGSSSSSTVGAGSEYASKRGSTPQHGQATSSNPADVAKGETSAEGGQAGLPDSTAIASAAAKGKGPGDEFSSAILSSEAERILENAKKRLTLMEGNLNRARSTVRQTPSPSPSPSTPGRSSPGLHQPGGLYRSISRTDRKSSSLRRQSMLSSQDPSNNRHSRVHSETNFPSESSLSTDPRRLSRSVSAMGASSVSNFHNDERTFHYEPTRAYLTHRTSLSSMRRRSSDKEQPVQTVPSPIPSEDSRSDSPKGLGVSAESRDSNSPAAFSPIYTSFGPPSRAQSQLQVRDLQYQMKGLHIKISSLKVKTQEDNLRRRSLQSLRTPSPSSAPEPWYDHAMELRDAHSSRGSTTRRGASAEFAREIISDNGAVRSKGRYSADGVDRRAVEQATMDRAKHTGAEWRHPGSDDYNDGRRSVADSMYEDTYEGDIDREALNEILREPLDEDLESPFDAALDAFPAVPNQTDETPHEEREDAFDYEHFILHSALGNYTRQLRRASNISSGSVETTRPNPPERHSRSESAMSGSTDATFATATEGEQVSDDEDDMDSVLYWDRRFNHELRHPRVRDHHDASHNHEDDRSETPRGSREDGSGQSTPVDPHRPSSQNAEPPGRSSSAMTGTATPTSLASSLVSTVRAAGSVTPNSGGINEDDTQMLERLFQSLGNVCIDLQEITTSPDPDMKTARVLRRRLDAARRALDGELDA